MTKKLSLCRGSFFIPQINIGCCGCLYAAIKKYISDTKIGTASNIRFRAIHNRGRGTTNTRIRHICGKEILAEHAAKIGAGNKRELLSQVIAIQIQVR